MQREKERRYPRKVEISLELQLVSWRNSISSITTSYSRARVETVQTSKNKQTFDTKLSRKLHISPLLVEWNYRSQNYRNIFIDRRRIIRIIRIPLRFTLRFIQLFWTKHDLRKGTIKFVQGKTKIFSLI